MDSYTQMLRKREELEKALAISGRRDLLPLADLAVFSGDDGLFRDLLSLANDQLLVTQPELNPFIPGPDPIDGLDPASGLVLGPIVGGGGNLVLPANLCSEGVGVFGTTGTGKTMIIAWLVRQLIKRGIRVWVWDSENEFADLLADLVLDGRVLAISYRDLRRNIFEPAPGELPMEAIGRVAGLLRGALYLRDGSQNLLAEILTRLFTERGVLNGSQDYPCAADVEERLRAVRASVPREAEYLVTLRNRFGDLVRSMGQVYEVSKGFPLDGPEGLLEHSIIWRLGGLDKYHHPFMVQDLLSWVMAYRERHRPGRLTHVFVIDEVHRLVSGDGSRDDLGEPLLVGAARVTRRAGVGLLVADQIPHKLPAALMGNLGTRIVFRLFEGRDVQAMAMSMSLSREQMAYLPQLGLRRVVVHTKAYPSAFMVEVPDLLVGGNDADA